MKLTWDSMTLDAGAREFAPILDCIRRGAVEPERRSHSPDAEIAAQMAAAAERHKKAVRSIPLFIRLHIRDLDTGKVHLIGTSVHDRLYVDEDGAVQYENLQNGGSTAFGAEKKHSYEFVATEEDSPF